MRDFFPFDILKKAKEKIYSLENILANQWILTNPMQAVPVILLDSFSNMCRSLNKKFMSR